MAIFCSTFDFIKRDEATGTWTNIMGRNLGLDTRELGFSMNRQGDWKVGLDYSELVHREIRTINTGMVGARNTTPTVVRLATPGSGSDLNNEMKRQKSRGRPATNGSTRSANPVSTSRTRTRTGRGCGDVAMIARRTSAIRLTPRTR